MTDQNPPSTPTQVALDAFESFATGRYDNTMSLFAEDATWVQPGRAPISGTHEGRAAVARLFGDLLEHDVRVRVLSAIAEGNRVSILSRVELAGEAADEVDLVTVRDGQIAHVQHVGDTAMLHRAYGIYDCPPADS